MRHWTLLILAIRHCAVAASPDGTRNASGSADGTIRRWGPGGRLITTLSEETKP